MTTTTTITTDQPLMTLINVFTVDPARQQELIDVLADATSVMAGLPGFISANLHRSVDGRRVVNYVQWRSKDDFDAMMINPQAAPHMKQAADMSSYDPIICDVVYTGHP